MLASYANGEPGRSPTVLPTRRSDPDGPHFDFNYHFTEPTSPVVVLVGEGTTRAEAVSLLAEALHYLDRKWDTVIVDPFEGRHQEPAWDQAVKKHCGAK